VQILQGEGFDVLVATGPEAASVLLDSSSPVLIVALAPLLGDALRDLFKRKAPAAEVRVVGSLGTALQDAVLSPREALDFSVRVAAAVAGVLAQSRGTPRERTARILEWSGKAAAALGMTASEVLAARLTAALYDVPQALDSEVSDEGVTLQDLRRHWTILAEFARGLAPPVALAEEPPEGDAWSRAPSPVEIVEAAAEYALLLERRAAHAALELRKRASGGLHPAAIEAVLGAAGGMTAKVRGRVLLADPDAAARSLLALRLVNEGYEVETVGDGRAALEAARARPPALIVSEAVLPGLDGYGLLDTLKREGKGGIPFLFLSSRADPLSVNKGLLLGAADFLPKPVNTEVLLTKLQKLLGQAILASEVSARISLSDLDRPAAAEYPTVTYDELAPGVTVLGRFEILADLGEGGMGKVFKARDARLEEDVVIKVMKDSLTGDPKVLEHFKREIRLARKISHPAVVRIHDFWEAGPLKFVTMEFLEGTDLRHEIQRRGAFPLPVALRLGSELFEGLAAAHDLGVVHRDIKPHNVLLLKGGHLKILDFGIAQGLDPASPDARTITATPIGTPEYMSPEQLLGERLDARTDLYSAGVVLFELLTGRLPFGGPDRMSVATMRLHTAAPPPSTVNPGVAPDVDALVLRLLARDRAERFASSRDALAELRAIRM
jgi:CheY-like chemotaxis protein